ncbi:PREDICTED: cytochrome P450 81E8-like [Tarenaya hassleriana]|uniref:cytochrome P450 81E8-like n=1 Tax=Tarenaya hassleriana TaxID=28532 RepID=UPI00053C7F89|nr:PREDICTED: cytochrome P450 81E8-like [Tarenaya hassleriana]
MENLWFVFLAVFVITTAFFVTKTLAWPNRKVPPGPIPLPITGHLHLIQNKPLPQALHDLSLNYGPFLFLKFGCRPVLVLPPPEAIEECFTDHDITVANRPRTITSDHFSGYKNFGFAPYGDLWRNLRRLSTLEAFSSASLQKNAFVQNEEVSNLCSKLFRLCSSDGDGDGSRKVDLKHLFTLLTVHMMLRIVAGKRGVELKKSEVDPESETRLLDDFKARFFSSMSMNHCDFLPVLRWIGYKGIERRAIQMQRMRDEYLQNLVDEVRSERNRSNDQTEIASSVVEKFLSLQESDPELYPDDVIKGIIVLMFNAGTDTSPGTMEWAMFVLLNHPDKLEKLRAEIEANVKHDRLIRDSDLQNLPYLRCVIYETLRLYPAAPLLLPHYTSKKFSLDGYEIPANTMVLVNAWAVHRDGKLWDEAEAFKPERFEGFVGDRDGFRFLPFGVGRRACPGAGMGMRTVALTVGAMVQCFEWEKIGQAVDMRPVFNVAMVKAEPLVARCRPRAEMVQVLSQL